MGLVGPSGGGAGLRLRSGLLFFSQRIHVLFVHLHFGLIFIFTINVGRLNDFYGKCR